MLSLHLIFNVSQYEPSYLSHMPFLCCHTRWFQYKRSNLELVGLVLAEISYITANVHTVMHSTSASQSVASDGQGDCWRPLIVCPDSCKLQSVDKASKDHLTLRFPPFHGWRDFSTRDHLLYHGRSHLQEDLCIAQSLLINHAVLHPDL